MDGSGASLLFRHANGQKKNIHWVKAGHVGDALAESKVVKNPNIPILLVDIAPENEEVAAFLHDRGNFIVIDHHASAAKFDGKHGYRISVDNEACGTELFRQWLVKNGLIHFDYFCFKRFAAIIDDHDRWIHSYPMSMQLPRFFAFAGQFEFNERFLNIPARFEEDKDFYWNDFEINVLDLINKAQVRRFNNLLTKFVVKFVPYKDSKISVGYIISGEVNCSELLHEYLDANPEVDVACQINVDLGKVSLRSNDKVDIVDFTKPWKGGGHKNAGGQSIPDGVNDMIIRSIHGTSILE